MQQVIKRFRQDVRGASFVEYVILVGLLAVICIGVYSAFGAAIQEKIDQYTDAVKGMETGG